jgi:hypothetical protein
MTTPNKMQKLQFIDFFYLIKENYDLLKEMIIFLLFSICLLLAVYLYISTSRKESSSYITETIQFFSSHDTPWLSSQQLKWFNSCTSYDCYSSKIASCSEPLLIIDMLVGQPLKYIWRDRNVKELVHYLKSLQYHKVKYQKSIRDHSSLYTDDFGKWPLGQDIVNTFIQIKK